MFYLDYDHEMVQGDYGYYCRKCGHDYIDLWRDSALEKCVYRTSSLPKIKRLSKKKRLFRITGFAFLPKRMNDGQWVWLRPYYYVWHPIQLGHGYWYCASTIKGLAKRHPQTPPPPKPTKGKL